MKTKIKNIRKTILMLMGGVTLISTPLAITSCGNNWKWETQSFSDVGAVSSWLSSLITVNNETKTVYTPDEYASFFYNDLKNENLWFSCCTRTLFYELTEWLLDGNPIKISTVIEEHKVGVKIVNQGPVKSLILKIDFSKMNLNVQFIAKTSKTNINFTTKETFQNIRVSVTNTLYITPNFGLGSALQIRSIDGHIIYDELVIEALQAQFPNYTFQTNNSLYI